MFPPSVLAMIPCKRRWLQSRRFLSVQGVMLTPDQAFLRQGVDKCMIKGKIRKFVIT